ncbi:hypothetical protein PUN28_002288 [Cardiocondyla obscurior]|uniref:Uncharacterized protein n=1 Tax=Cardiocondyla obscurior TaxID=286306 RepID=A0AAW2GTB4_9HYME
MNAEGQNKRNKRPFRNSSAMRWSEIFLQYFLSTFRRVSQITQATTTITYHYVDEHVRIDKNLTSSEDSCEEC